MKVTTGKILQIVRNELELTRKDIYRSLGIPMDTLANIERDLFTSSRIEMLCEFYGIKREKVRQLANRHLEVTDVVELIDILEREEEDGKLSR